MSKPSRGNRNLIKAMNRNLILNILRGEGPLSRSQLSETSGLSAGAVSEITNALLSENWIIEDGTSDYTGGRRQVLLRLNPTAGYLVGVKLMENRIVCAVTDLETKVLTYIEQPLVSTHTPQAVTASLARAIRRSIKEAGIDRERLLGVGIGLAGVIDYEGGIVHYSPFFQWRDVPLAEMVAQKVGLPVYIENDVNTLTLIEQLFGDGHGVANFAVVTIGRGVGMGMVLNHQRYLGTRGGAGELGHISFDPGGPPCNCGKTGCLEAYAADAAVIDYVKQALETGTKSALQMPVSLIDVVQAAQGNDALAQEALARSGDYLGRGLAVVINVLCPSLIIVSGEGMIAGEYRLQPMLKTLREYVFDGLLDNVEIRVKLIDDQTWARGAAGLVVGQVFESPLLSGEYTTEADLG